jgi:O6-methylguanine-DNA--protein-cysteine methyltransferase
MAKNPLPIVIPCHRVVAADGPGGFSLFGSLASKERLLALEGRRLRHTGSPCTPLFPMDS